MYLLSSLDFLLYLCFNDDDLVTVPVAPPSVTASSSSSRRSGSRNSSSNNGAPQRGSGLEKAQLLLANTSPQQWGPLTRPFVQRYVQGATAANTRSASSSLSSTTPAEKFTRKDLTKAAQAQAFA